MRFLFGIIVGVALTLGTAYVFDATRRPSGPDGVAERPMVNLDVVESELKNLSVAIHDGWDRLTGHKNG
jgi:hypothetical protein